MTSYTWRRALREAAFVLMAIVFIAPVYILINLSFGDSQAQLDPLRPVSDPTLGNYREAWESGGLGMSMVTTIFVTAVSVFLIIALSSMTAYALARITSRWSTLVFYVVLFGLVLPFFIALVPLYQTMNALNLLGTPAALILLNVGLHFPLSVFLYTGFIRQVPRDYEDAALIDGCSPTRAFTAIVLPLVRPVTGTVAILNAITIWNDFLPPLLFLGSGDFQMLPVAIYGFVGEYTAQWPLIFAGVTISILPLLIVFFVMQRRVMTGFGSGLKG